MTVHIHHIATWLATKRPCLGLALALATLVLAISTVARADSGRLYTANEIASSLTSCIAQDKHGYIWIGTENGLSRYDGYHFTTYMRGALGDEDSTTLVSSEISNLFVDSKGDLWIGCDQMLMRYDYRDNCFRRYPFPQGLNVRVEDLLEDESGDIVIGTAGYGLYKLRRDEDRITKYDIEGWKNSYDFANRLFRDDRGDIWFANHLSIITRIRRNSRSTSFVEHSLPCGPAVSFVKTDGNGFYIVCLYGILRYDYSTGAVTATDIDMSALDSNVSIRKALVDHVGNIYIGTSGKGLMVVPAGSKTLRQVATKDKDFDLSTSNVNYILEDKDHNIWVSCYKRGIYQLRQDKEAFSSWDFASQRHFLGSGLSSIAPGNDGDIWATVQKAGVYCFDKHGNITAHPSSPYSPNTIYRDRRGNYWLCTENTLYAYDPYTGHHEQRMRYDGWGLNCMTDDGQGRLYICNYGKGLCIYDTQSGTSTTLGMGERRKLGSICNNWIKALFVDSQGLLWVGSADGVSCMDTRDTRFHSFGSEPLLMGMQSFAFGETGDGRILIGTNNGLYQYDKARKVVSLFPGAEKISDNSIYSIVIDQHGDMWLGTARGILLYDKTERSFTSYVSGNGLATHEYIIGAAVHSPDDRMAMGTNDGITVFYPEEVKGSTLEMDSVYLTNFTLNGKPIYSFSDHFTVPHAAAALQLEFSLLNFKHTEEVEFQYRINDSREWLAVRDGSNAIQFNELMPGKYDIYVRAECGGKYSRATRKITITVKHPWYSSTVAWVVYILLVCAIIAYVIRQNERRKRKELDEAKMRILINATHDIRSPLTLIMGPLAKLKQRLTDKESLADIDIIDRNAQRLLLLVNQILDERKIDKQQMRLRCQHTDLAAQVGGVVAMFQGLARSRSIALRVECDDEVWAWVDRTNFDKVMQNLISNSFKFTHDGGDICIRLSQDAHSVVIEVEDTGIGFGDEDTDKIFDRFYQGRNTTLLKAAGTGIGLNLCRTLIQMHGGNIKASNRADGEPGAVITITLRKGNSHLKLEEIISEEEADKQADKEATKRLATKRISVMVVDDDPEIAAYIAKELGEHYKCHCFNNGSEALQALLVGNYDLVISDIVMPGMDGIALLKSIKTNSRVSETPVILLTSKVDAADRLEGFKKGADAYMPKPFDMAELRVMIDNLVDRVRRMKGKFTGAQAQEDKVEHIKVKGNNDALMERIMKSINKNISNPDFNVEILADDIGISRAQLHRKMKEITGISTGEFIRNLRLEQAARLIRESQINITQVAYNVGFSNQTHFSTVFKKHFGVSPTEYAERSRRESDDNTN